MRSTDAQGRPLIVVPRRPLHPALGGPATVAPLAPAIPVPVPSLPPAATDEESLYALVNSMRELLLASGLAVEKEGA